MKKYITKFSTTSEYEAAYGGGGLDFPNISLINNGENIIDNDIIIYNGKIKIPNNTIIYFASGKIPEYSNTNTSPGFIPNYYGGREKEHKVVSHTFENGIGKIVFDKDLIDFTDYNFGEGSTHYLTGIIFPDSITKFNTWILKGCSNVTYISLPNYKNNTNFSDDLFGYCISLPCINNLLYANYILVKAIDNSVLSYSIKNGTKIISDYAFANRTNAEEIIIPSSIKEMGIRIMYGCTNLKTVKIYAPIAPKIILEAPYTQYTFQNIPSATVFHVPINSQGYDEWFNGSSSRLIKDL